MECSYYSIIGNFIFGNSLYTGMAVFKYLVSILLFFNNLQALPSEVPGVQLVNVDALQKSY